MFDRFTDRAKMAMTLARQEAQRLGHDHMGPEHMLLGLIQVGDGGAFSVLQALGADLGTIRTDLEALLERSSNPVKLNQLPFTPSAKRVLELTMEEAGGLGHNYIGTEHLLLGLIKELDSPAARVLADVGVELEEAREELLDYLGSWSIEDDESPAAPVVIPGSTAPNLRAFGEDLTQRARDGAPGPTGDHSGEVDHMIRILCRLSVNNVALVGSPGVGKQEVLRALAHKIITGDVPGPLDEIRLLSVDVAAARQHGYEPVAWVDSLVSAARRGRVIPCFPELDEFVGLMPDGYADLQAHLLQGGLQCVVVSTEDAYAAHLGRHPTASRLFKRVVVPPPSAENSIKILARNRGRYEEQHWAKIPDEVLELAVELSVLYLPDRDLPEKAEGLIDEAASLARMRAGRLPAGTRAKLERIEKIGQRAEEAIENKQCELGASLHEEARRRKLLLMVHRREWTTGRTQDPSIAAVKEQHIYTVLGGLTGISVEALQARKSIPPRRAPGHERE